MHAACKTEIKTMDLNMISEGTYLSTYLVHALVFQDQHSWGGKMLYNILVYSCFMLNKILS